MYLHFFRILSTSLKKDFYQLTFLKRLNSRCMAILLVISSEIFLIRWQILISLLILISSLQPESHHHHHHHHHYHYHSNNVSISEYIDAHRNITGNFSAIKHVLDYISAAAINGHHPSLFIKSVATDACRSPSNSRIPYILHQTWRDSNIASHADDALAIQASNRQHAHGTMS